MEFKEFENIIKEIFPEISSEQLCSFEAMNALYREWNAQINVISRKDIDQLYRHHVLHSLAIAVYLKKMKLEFYDDLRSHGSEYKILDLGTGGGFPGIPLAILFPNVKFTLCDSVGKKTIVAKGVSQALNLSNVKVINARAETLPEKYDFIVSRAVTALDNFIPWVKGKYNKGILYLKGGDIAEEISRTMSKFHIPKGCVHTWPIETWLDDEYFSEKLVIYIEKFCN